ncbi:PEPxxWA-CTERM sorting domain-containing protein [Sphingomonas aliaeris]
MLAMAFGSRSRGKPSTSDQESVATNGLTGTENSATYIFRTNATAFNNMGTFGVIDGSTLQGMTFQPITAVPETATWGMMIAGFGMTGAAMRTRRRSTKVAFA